MKKCTPGASLLGFDHRCLVAEGEMVRCGKDPHQGDAPIDVAPAELARETGMLVGEVEGS